MTANETIITNREVARAIGHINQNGNKVSFIASCENSILLRIDHLSMPQMRIGCAFRAVGYSVEFPQQFGAYTQIKVTKLN